MTTRGGMELQDQVIARASELAERGNGMRARVAERGSELRDRALEGAERAREAVCQARRIGGPTSWPAPASRCFVIV